MGFAQKLLVGHHHDHDTGGVITHPRGYELFADILFLGQRARIWDRLVAASGAQPGERVLDIGCGSGYFSRRIAPVVGAGGTVVGIDPSQPMLDYATRHAPANCGFQAAGAQDLPFADASFDLAVSSLAFHHIPVERRADAVREIFRVLRPGGRALIADVRPPSIPVLKRLISGAIGHAMAHNISHQLRELITDAGFTVTGSGDEPLLRYITTERPPDQ
jgi:ubiquinone/menaquinone biosynthesis C-methylase UbiE